MNDRPHLLAELEFPSDRLTLGTLRRRFPQAFDRPPADAGHGMPFFFDRSGNGPGHTVRERLFDMMESERQLAFTALVEAQGSTRTDPDAMPPEEDRAVLIKRYQEFGLAEGPEHAKQLIRNLESAAAALDQGRSRS